jgi:hypothetical protein
VTAVHSWLPRVQGAARLHGPGVTQHPGRHPQSPRHTRHNARVTKSMPPEILRRLYCPGPDISTGCNVQAPHT